MDCIKCKMPLPDGSEFCCWCGSKQTEPKRAKKSPHGTGTVRKLSGNRRKPWIALLPNSANKQYIGSFATRKEAVKALSDALSNSKTLDKYNITFSQLYSEYTETHFKNLTASGKNSVKASYKYYEPLYDAKFRDIRTDSVQPIINRAFADGKSKATCKKIKQLYGALCKYAMQFDIINKNYADFVELPKEEKSEKKIFTKEQIEELLKRADTDDTAKAVLILIYSGMRVGELIDMKIENVDLENQYMIGGNKTEAGKNRLFPFHNAVSEYIKYFYIKNREYGYLITSPERKKMSYKNFRDRYFKPLLKEIGADGLTFHSARHTFATLGQAAGIAPEDMIRLIGHTNYKTTTENYIHQNLEKLRSAINKIK